MWKNQHNIATFHPLLTMTAAHPKGLSSVEAEKLLAKYGPNILPGKKADPWWRKLLKQFADIMVLILLGAALVAFFLDEKIDATLIFAIVFANAVIGFLQEWRSEKTLEALKNMVSPEATVLRDGTEQAIEARLLVPGDLVVLREGDRIPADITLEESSELKVEEAALTGESEAVEKAVQAAVFLGTAVVSGSGQGVVAATGSATRFGNVAKLTLTTKSAKSPLEQEIFGIGVFVGKVAAVLICAIFILDFFFNSADFLNALLYSISVAVAAVPEGLPATITIALALGVQRLARKKAVVKQLSSAETLGATTVICSDKTGTITKNEMTVRAAMLADGAEVKFTGEGLNTFGDLSFAKGENTHSAALLQEVMAIAVNCNDAKLSADSASGEMKLLGDPTEGALLVAARKFMRAFPKLPLPTLQLVKKFPFDSRRKLMSVLGKNPQGQTVLMTKGAAEMLLPKCTHYFDGTEIHALTPAKRTALLKGFGKMTTDALRVLAFAAKELGGDLPQDAAQAETGLTFYGVLGMMDPPRSAVPEAVRAAHGAGIRIIMITGDNPETARAIAREVGIFQSTAAIVLTGVQLAKMSDAELTKVLFTKQTAQEQRGKSPGYAEVLFARVSPEDKLRIVSLLQQKGEVVAVTGDGVNDAPALKKANIGVAMGRAGTEVAKEAAHLVLLDDSFATIVAAIREGRKIFENLRKFIWFLFSGNIAELIVVIAALVLSVPNPLSAVLLLLINLGTDLLPAIALSFESEENQIMDQPPRNSKTRILSRRFILHFFQNGIVLACSTLAGFFWLLFSHGWSWASEVPVELHRHLMSMTFTILVLGQMFIALSARHFYASAFHNFFGNPRLLGAIAVSVLIVAGVLYIPFLQRIFGTAPLTVLELSMSIALASAVLWVEEIRKIVTRSRS